MTLDELKTLEAKATPGPWRVEQDTTLIWSACNPDDKTTWGMGYPITEVRLPAAWRQHEIDHGPGRL